MTVALDTDFVLHLAEANEETWDVYSTLVEHFTHFDLIVTPVVANTLEFFSRSSEGSAIQRVRRAWRGLNDDWRVTQLALTEAQRKVAWILNYQLRQAGLLAETARLEAELLGEAGLVADILLAAPDSVVHRIDPKHLIFETRMLGLPGLLVFKPKELMQMISH